MKIIDGKKIAEKIKKELFEEIKKARQVSDERPHLAIILVGDRTDSKIYVSLKEKTAREIGMDSSLYLIDKEADEKEIIDTIQFLNQDDSIDGILLQLPLPAKFNTEKILKLINPQKDVDGFNRSAKFFLSPVLLAIQLSLEESKIDWKNKKAFLFYNSEVFKNEVEEFLKQFKIKLKAISSRDLDKSLEEKETALKVFQGVKSSQILISAMGRPGLIDNKFLGQQLLFIDIGISKLGTKVLGDFNFSQVKDSEAFITPVPGGIGPITVVCLLKNVWQSFLRKREK